MTTTKAAEPTARSLHEKLVALRANFGPIRKTGENTALDYNFVEASEVGRKFVEDASGYGLTMLPVGGAVIDRYPSISGKQHVVDLQQTWRITDSASGESIEIVSFGQGADNADKALPKAQTNAMKYAILLVLQAAGDDAEADPNTDRLEAEAARSITVGGEGPRAVAAKREDAGAASPSPVLLSKLMATFSEKGLRDADKRKAFTSATVGKSSSRELTVADVEKLLVALADFRGVIDTDDDVVEPASVAGGD